MFFFGKWQVHCELESIIEKLAKESSQRTSAHNRRSSPSIQLAAPHSPSSLNSPASDKGSYPSIFFVTAPFFFCHFISLTLSLRFGLHYWVCVWVLLVWHASHRLLIAVANEQANWDKNAWASWSVSLMNPPNLLAAGLWRGREVFLTFALSGDSLEAWSHLQSACLWVCLKGERITLRYCYDNHPSSTAIPHEI